MKKYIVILSVLCMQVQGLTKDQKRAIGMQIWKNETGQNYTHLVFWNPNETFPTLGIGLFIWYPANKEDVYTQTFPDLLDYLSKNSIKFPTWLEKARKEGAPWQSKEDLAQHNDDPQVKELQKLLFNTIDLQAAFIIERLYQAWPRILKHAVSDKRPVLKSHFNNLTQTPRGMYALVDYLNLKGEGTNVDERYNGKGWGLLQVLEVMPETTSEKTAVDAFAQAAKQILEQRIVNAPVSKPHEKKWLQGWKNRIDTYRTFS